MTTVRHRRGFSLVEATVTLAVAGILTATVVLTAQPGSRAAGDAQARTRLEQVVDAAEEVRSRQGGLVSDLAVYDAALENLTVTDGTPADGQVSLAVADGALGAAVLVDDGACFLVRRDWAAAPGEPLLVRAIAPSQAAVTCDGSTALGVVAGDRGRSWDEPVLLTGTP